MAKIIKLRGSNSKIYGSSGGLFEGGLLTICSARVGAYSRGGGFFEWGQFVNLRLVYNEKFMPFGLFWSLVTTLLIILRI